MTLFVNMVLNVLDLHDLFSYWITSTSVLGHFSPGSFRSLFKDRNEQRTEVSEDQSDRVTSVLDADLSIKGPISTSLNNGFISHNAASVHLYVSLLTSHAGLAPAGYVWRRQSQSLSGSVHVMQQVEKIIENMKFLFCRRQLPPWTQCGN